jgi:hypothetical protein
LRKAQAATLPQSTKARIRRLDLRTASGPQRPIRIIHDLHGLEMTHAFGDA